MGTCKNCSRSGLFLSVSGNGLCSNCDALFLLDFRQRARIIAESQEIIDKSKSLETRLSRCDVLVEMAEGLIPYERKGIPTLSPPPSQIVASVRRRKDGLILESLTGEFRRANDHASVEASLAKKTNAYTKLLLRIREYSQKSINPNMLKDLETSVMRRLDETKLTAYLENAQKAEFKGQNKKALDQFYEALYLLKNDSIDDRLQQDHLKKIEASISRLGGKVG